MPAEPRRFALPSLYAAVVFILGAGVLAAVMPV